jgi:hypothetical protein
VRARTLILAVGVTVSLAIVAIFSIGIERQEAGLDQSESPKAAFDRLSAERHTIDRIEFFGWNAGSGSAGIVMRGNRGGDYHISWRMTETASGQVLAQDRKMVTLGPGRRTVVIGFVRDNLIAAYREKILEDMGGAGGTSVDETFRLTASVAPALSPEENAALPPREVRNLALGQSLLRSDSGIDIRFSFQLPVAPAVRTD